MPWLPADRVCCCSVSAETFQIGWLCVRPVEWSIIDVSQSRGQIFWLTAYLCPVRLTFWPSNPLLIYILGRPTPRRGLRAQQQQQSSSRASAVAAAAATHHTRPRPAAAAIAAGHYFFLVYTLTQCPDGARKAFQRVCAGRGTDFTGFAQISPD